MKIILKRFTTIVYISLLTFMILLSTGCSIIRSMQTFDTFDVINESDKVEFSDIIWTNDSLSTKIKKKIAFFIPVKIKGIERVLYMQLDTGTPKTIFYERPIREFAKLNTNLEKQISETDDIIFMNQVELKLNDNILTATKIRIKRSYGDSNIDSNFVIIGTLGFDILVGRTLILDFINNKYSITTRRAEELNYKIDYIQDASVDKFPLLIPAKIGDKEIRLLYDTGSSMFTILISIDKFNSMSTNSSIDTIGGINSWGTMYNVYRTYLDEPVSFDHIILNNQPIYGIEKKQFLDYFPDWYYYGKMGNKLFENKIIIIDNVSNKFGIVH